MNCQLVQTSFMTNGQDVRLTLPKEPTPSVLSIEYRPILCFGLGFSEDERWWFEDEPLAVGRDLPPGAGGAGRVAMLTCLSAGQVVCCANSYLDRYRLRDVSTIAR